MKRQFFLVYHGGFTAGMVLDHQIRLRSNGEFTLAILMRNLYTSHSRENPYSSDSILKLIRQSTQVDFSLFFERHIYNSEIIPVGNYFELDRLMMTTAGIAPPSESKEQQVLADMLTFD